MMKKLTDMEIGELSTRPTTSRGSVLPSPYFAIEDKSAESVINYDNGSVALGYKKCEGYTSVYSALGLLDAATLREICRVAGVHIYSENAPVYVNSKVIGVYAVEDAEITLKQSGVYEDVFTGKRYETRDNKISVKAEALHSKLFIKI